MENVNSLDECKKQKEAFFFILRRIILASCVLLLFFILNMYEQNSKNEVINAFKNGNEVICNSSIVSIKNGYEFEKNRVLQPIYSYSQPVNIRTVRIEKSLSL